jgi:hypothetical protein
MNLAGKSFLITQPMIHGLNGSTMVALELADYLQSQGAKVQVYTNVYKQPASLYFENKKLEVKTFSDAPEYELTSFDFIWIHSQVLPPSVIRQLSKELPAKMPTFIFFHMSKFDWIPDERPYIYQMEERLSSQSLFVSKEVKTKQLELFEQKPNCQLFRNPAPVSFSEAKYETRSKLKKILIVSNHPPQEVVGARQLLANQGIKVDILGEKSDSYQIVTPKLLAQYDVVVTIGKTVQYCLVMGVPVYLYDWFGGPGYLNSHNFKNAAEYNFSGRDTPHQKPDNLLVNDILDRWSDAIKYQQKNRQVFIRQFSIDNVLPQLIGQLKPRQLKKFTKPYMEMVINNQTLSYNRFHEGAMAYDNFRWATVAEESLAKTKQQYNFLEKDKLSVENRLRLIESDFSKISKSQAYRVGRIVVKPASLAKKAVKKLLKTIQP